MQINQMVEKICFNNEVLALIVYRDFRKNGIHFFTEDDYSQQLAYMCHPPGKKIAPHTHNLVQREVLYTQETLIIKSGKLRVDFYNSQQIYLESRILKTGDVILLVSGGHGFEILEETEMFEVKQGPYAGDNDKTRFECILPEKIIIKN